MSPNERPNKGMKQPNGALAEMEAPLAAHPQLDRHHEAVMRIRVRRDRRGTRETRGPIRVLDEVRYIVELAARHDSRVVGIGPLVFFSTAAGDASVLDPADESALCLARNGSALPVNIKESAEHAIEWTHRYRIDGSVMAFSASDGKTSVVAGYPTEEILRTARRLNRG